MYKIIYIFVLMSLYLPVNAESSIWKNMGDALIPCKPQLAKNGSIVEGTECGFYSLVQGVSNVINFLIELGIVISVLMFAYAGFLYITEREKAKERAKKIFMGVIMGMFFMLAAWLIVQLILKGLGAEDTASFLTQP
ncbi:MAG: hypothetical protein V1851_03240 [Patescibacteria group bacterium]